MLPWEVPLITHGAEDQPPSMNCPECNTWNPEDKNVCWKCQTEMPKPPPPKPKRQTFGGMPIWVWVALALLFIVMNFGFCAAPPTGV